MQPPPLTPQQRTQWNLFIDFLDKQGLKGHPSLDMRDKNMGQFYFNKFAQANPLFQLKYEDVPQVQQDLQEYRTDLVNHWKAGKAVVDGVKTEADIMPGLSQVDGWLGSKTSSYKFPSYTNYRTDNGTTTKTEHGTDFVAFGDKGGDK